jgi:hypothetical protein
LTAPSAAGLRDYWFDETVLGSQWFEAQFEHTKAMLDKRFHPDDHVEVEAAEFFGRLRRTKSWRDKLAIAVELIREHSGLAPSTSSESIRNTFSKDEDAAQTVLSRDGAILLPHDQPTPIAE